MKLINQLKIQSLKKNLFFIIIMLSLSIICLVFPANDYIGRSKPIAIDEFDTFDIYNNKDKYYKGNIFLLKPYSPDIESIYGIPLSRGEFYLAIFDNKNLISIFICNDDIAKADENCKENSEAINNGSNLIPYAVYGKINTIFNYDYRSSAIAKLSDSYLNEENEEIANKLGMTLMKLNIGSYENRTFDIAFFTAGVIFLIVAIILVIASISGKYQKKLKKSLDKQGILGNEKFEAFYETEKGVNGIKVNNEYLYLNGNAESFLFDPNEIVWIYQEIRDGKYGSIIYYLNFYTDSGRMLKIAQSRFKIDDSYKYLQDKMPNTHFGYSLTLSQIYSKNPFDFRKNTSYYKSTHPHETFGVKIPSDRSTYQFPCDKK